MKKTFTFLLLLITYSLLGNSSDLFYIECPEDVTVQCDDELWDLSIYGTAYAYGYGNPTPLDSPDVDINLNDCNVGTILRTWTTTDYSGNIYSCTQTITVESNLNEEQLNIQWPENYTVNACSANLEPENIPAPYNYPTWNDQSCAMIMQNYSDAVYQVDKGCKKVLRTWKLIDWCRYDPNDPYATGIWKHTQILKVMSTEKPDISCIPDITMSAGEDCYYTYLDLNDVTASNTCNSSIEITNNSAYADNNGPDASGHYPLGTTVVKYTARDACGNESTCMTSITVVDQKLPVPICLHGLSATLAVHHDGYYVRLYPELFNKGSYDNCTKASDLIIKVEPEILTCADLDTAKVKLIVTDEEGNSNYCETYVYLTDNQDKCPPPSPVTFTGDLTDLMGRHVSDVDIILNSQDELLSDKSDGEGHFEFAALTSNTKYQLSAKGLKTDMYKVNTWDGILMHQMLKGDIINDRVAVLAAADVDGNGELSAYDVWRHKQMILDPTDEADGSTIRLINSDAKMNRSFHIPGGAISIKVNDNPVQSGLTIVRSGDLGESLYSSNQALSTNPLNLVSDIESLEAGQQYSIELRVDEAINLLGYQYTLEFDHAKVSEINVNYNRSLGVNPGDFGLSKKAEGIILCSYISDEGLELSEGDIFLSVDISVTKTCKLEEVLSMTNRVLESEIYSEDRSKRPILIQNSLTGLDQELKEEIRMEVYPNPISQDSEILVYLPNEVIPNSISIRIVGLEGRTYYQNMSELRTGENKIRLTESLQTYLPQGVLILQLTTPKHIITKKLINP